jgi:predicted glycoside hydrolase/deacetylase ChbG (UPF0249 family)
MATNADVGMHLVLTQFVPLGPMPRLAASGALPRLNRLMALAYTGGLDPVEIGDEIDRQLDAFERGMGRPPDHVDGHHHVHQLPVVRDALIQRLGQRLPFGTAMRVCYEPLRAILERRIAMLRATVIAAGARHLRRAVAVQNIPCNRRFSGVRDFKEKVSYRDLFRRFIGRESGIRPKGLLIMCHPGCPDAMLRASDSVIEPRKDEFVYLASGEFFEDLDVAGMRVGRFRDLSAVER